jgi:predicted  nucleic acid-binding Zn-ribbon protein
MAEGKRYSDQSVKSANINKKLQKKNKVGDGRRAFVGAMVSMQKPPCSRIHFLQLRVDRSWNRTLRNYPTKSQAWKTNLRRYAQGKMWGAGRSCDEEEVVRPSQPPFAFPQDLGGAPPEEGIREAVPKGEGFPLHRTVSFSLFFSTPPHPSAAPQSASEVNAVAKSQSKELREAKGGLQQAQERCVALQANLDNAFKEIEQLGRDKADAEARVRQAEAAAQEGAHASLTSEVAKHRQELQEVKEEHEAQVEDLRAALRRAEAQAQRREKMLRDELAAMQQRVRETEERGEELSSSMSQATKPLMRQIASLQEAAATQQESWEVRSEDRKEICSCFL